MTLLHVITHYIKESLRTIITSYGASGHIPCMLVHFRLNSEYNNQVKNLNRLLP
jgi:hypothetical protein